MNKNEITLKENKIYAGHIIDLYDDDILCPNGNKSKREYVNHPGGVCILATKDNYIYFIKQFRYPYKKELIELPAGKLEKNEKPIEAAKRELEEEIGLKSLNMELIDYMYPSCGYTNEIIYLFYSPLNEITKTSFDEDEFIDLYKVSIDNAYEMLDNNEIHDAKTVYLLSKLRKRLLKNES